MCVATPSVAETHDAKYSMTRFFEVESAMRPTDTLFYIPQNRQAAFSVAMLSCTNLFLLVTVLAQTLFAFVGSHLVSFSFLTAWHNLMFFCTNYLFSSSIFLSINCVRVGSAASCLLFSKASIASRFNPIFS